ncbi:MAG: histidinol-phosphate transaminase [Candidatus Omnitrophica bacterium]|nr:histidinol-phosphate transaminase [Candidatus Omnitrophota bacterium]MBU1933213.1 histidinol-phosphate transaminase [Candidatus Omnitrophota bacterium]
MPRKSIQNIKPYQPGKPIEEVKRELGLRDVIKLASNENPFGPSPKAVAAIKKHLYEVNRYPESSCFYLRQALSKKIKVRPDQLVFGNGSDELILLALRAFVEEGDEVVVTSPTFLIYEIASRIQGAKIKIVPTRYFKYDLRAMKKAITKNTKIVFIANPDNPNGTYVTKNELEEFLKGLPEDLVVFIDEAYFDYVQERDYPDGLNYISRKNVIVTRTFSKSYGLAGLRIGYGVSNAAIIKYMEAVREPFNINSLAQAASVAALKDKKFLANIKKKTHEGRRFLYGELGNLGLRYIPSVTNFVLFEAGKDASKICKKLMKQGVIVRDMNAWGLDNFIRVTVGKEKENKRFIKELKKIIT